MAVFVVVGVVMYVTFPAHRVPPVHKDDLHQLGRKAARWERNLFYWL